MPSLAKFCFLTIILGRCPKPHRSALAILYAYPRALRYRLMAIVTLLR